LRANSNVQIIKET